MRFLLVLAIAAGVAYYAYKGIGTEETPTCSGAQNACMQKCRRTTTENAEAQACQASCTRERETCDREKARATQ
jgi:hypothetical protein